MTTAAPAKQAGAKQAGAKAERPEQAGEKRRWAPERRVWAGARPSTVPAKGCGCKDCSKPLASPPVNSFEDCPADWQDQANKGLATGRPWVANAATGLSNLPTPLPTRVSDLLNHHFHTTAAGDVKKIASNFQDINGAMNERVKFECETKCDDGVGGYVIKPFGSTVHLCPLWHTLPADMQANVIVHELAHLSAGRGDQAYIWEDKYKKLSASDAMDNADSYAYFAEDSFNNTTSP